MCELFGLSSSTPVAANGALGEFRLRGGLMADNPDGWGLAWWEDGAFRLSKEPLPASRSPLFAGLSDIVRSSLVIAHVRKARLPPINTLDNTHPFQRACCGKAWVFAHNGLVPDVVGMERANRGQICQPSGETDSEYAFCHLLSHIAALGDGAPFAAVAAISELIASHGKFNFLMSDGEYLIAYGHDRLHYLERAGMETPDGMHADCVMIATEPLLGSGAWIPFAAGELRIYRAGRLAERIVTQPLVRPLAGTAEASRALA